jgi:hypothetical protein
VINRERPAVTKPRKARADSIEAEIEAFRTATSMIEPPVRLPKRLLAFWHDIMCERAIGEWSVSDLRLAVEYIHALDGLDREGRRLRAEGAIYEGPQGRTPNPRARVVADLRSAALRLQARLGLSFAGRGLRKGDVAHQRDLEREVRARTDPVRAYLDAGGDPTELFLGRDEDNEILRSILPGGGDDAVKPIIRQMRARGGGKPIN